MNTQNLIDKYTAQLQESINIEQAAQIEKDRDEGVLVEKLNKARLNAYNYDLGAIDMVIAVTLDSIDRELSMMELREQITLLERIEIFEEIQ